MSKVYTFIELLSKIKEGKIKDKTRIQCFENGRPDIILKMRGKYIETDNGGDVTQYCNSGLFTLDDYTFKLIEEDTIDSIEELDICDFGHNNTISQQEAWIINKINEIIRKVNQLDKQLKKNMQ